MLGVCETTTIGIAPSAATQAIEERWTAGCDAIGNGYDLIADGVNTGDQSKVDDGIATFNQGVEVAGSALARADELLGRSRAGEVRAPDEDATPETEPTQAAPVADGRFGSTCDYVLGDFTESARGFRFVANADLKNTGEIGIVVRLAAQWKQGGKGPIKVVKTVKVPIGRTKNVGITRIATADEIDLHQATDQGCTVKASIIDTFAADDESPVPDAGTDRRVRLNPVPLFVPGSSGRCFTRNTNPDASITVGGRTYIAGVIQCGGHEPPEQRASGSYGFTQPASIPVSAQIVGFAGQAVVDETRGARPATLTLHITYDGKPVCSAVASYGDPTSFRCLLDHPVPADFSRIAFTQTVEPNSYYAWAGVIAPRVIVALNGSAPRDTAPTEQPPPTEPASTEQTNCHPSYQGACLDPNASDYDCAGGEGNGPEYTGTVTVIGPDEFDLDADGDGLGCE